MTKAQARQEKACAAARIQAMQNELHHLECIAIAHGREIARIDGWQRILKSNIAAEKNSVKDL
jgi:hypothetical protein